MATLEQIDGKLMPSLKKAATILTMAGFCAAAAFLAFALWMPANAATSSTAMDSQSSLLLALDKPTPPLPKLRLSQPSTTVEEEGDMMAALASRDLASELNNWTYTASGLSGIVSVFDSAIKQLFALQLNLIKSEMSFWAGVLQIAGLPNQQYLNAINFIQDAINALFAPISPHS
jgi:hypothetical protein